MPRDLLFKPYKAIKTLATQRILIECDRIPYQFHNVPLRKILNWILTEASMLRKPERPWGWPTHLQIEPSSYCNLKCILCPVTTGMNRPSGHMNFNTFKKIIDETGDYVFIIMLWDWGEPFLNPHIYNMISYAKKWEMKIISSTNGHVFAHGDHAEKLVCSGIDSIIFAMDGISQETYERYRAHGDLKKVIAGIKSVVEAKQALNSKTPLINLRFIPMKHNEHEITMLKDFAMSLGVDALTIKTLNSFDQGECHPEMSKGEDFMPENPLYQRFKLNPVYFSRIRYKKNPCKHLWNNPVIHWNGKVSPCTYDPHDKYILGDLTQQTFRDIWNGAPYMRFRHQFRKDYQQIEVCSECTYAYKGGSCATETIAKADFFDSSALKNKGLIF